MRTINFTKIIAILGFAGTLGMTPAMAQTTTGTMAPVQAASSAMAAAAPEKTGVPLPKSLEFTTTTAAAAHCPSDTVVWSTLSKSHSFHASGSRYFGKTKHGAYVCKGDALAAGFHQAKS
jgi:hypothetical protein